MCVCSVTPASLGPLYFPLAVLILEPSIRQKVKEKRSYQQRQRSFEHKYGKCKCSTYATFARSEGGKKQQKYCQQTDYWPVVLASHLTKHACAFKEGTVL